MRRTVAAGTSRRARRAAAVIASAGALAAAPTMAQSTAGFPPVTSPSPPPAPAPPAPYTPPAPAPYVAPRAPGPYPQSPPPPGYQPYPPSGYPQPYPMPPGYRPPAAYPQAPYPQGPQPPRGPSAAPVVPPGYVAPAYTPAPAPPPPPRDPLLDENLRFRQQLGAYRRGAAPPPPAPASRAAYVRIAPRTRHYHDGFYFRFALGVGTGKDTGEADRSLPTRGNVMLGYQPEPFDASGSALTPVTELAAGYAPWPGIVLGLGAYTATIGSRTMTSNDVRTGDYAFRLSQLAVFGPLVDYYPWADTGFHLQGSAGLSTFVAGAGTSPNGPLAQAHSATGFGFMLGVGYEWWIADQWSAGFIGRLVYGTGSGSDNRNVNWSHTAYAPSVLIGITFH